MNFTVNTFLNEFLRPPAGRNPQDIASQIRHHIDVANNPEEYCQDKSPFALRTKRRNARQSLRRLVLKHPEIAEQLMTEHIHEASQ